MLETPHALVGAAIASKIPNPFIAIPAALASHFILDRIPHWNPHSYTEVQNNGKISSFTTKVALVDVAVALTSGTLLSYSFLPDWKHAAVVFFSCFAAVLPDVAKSPYFLLGARKGIFKRWVDFERSLQVDTKKAIPGILTQAAVVGASLLWIVS